MTTSERLGHTLVAIPVAHILGSAFFLWSYCLGFGANLVVHASASDLFSVSVSDMVGVYGLSLVLPLSMTLMRVTSATPYAVDMANALPQHKQPRAHLLNRKLRRLINWFAIAIFVICSTRATYDFYYGHQFSYTMLWAALQIPTTIGWMTFCERRNYSSYTFEAGTLLGGFAVSLFCIGATKGQIDRFTLYSEAAKTHTSCGKNVVLRQVSSKFLAILPNNTRALISEDCKVAFRVPPPRGRPLFEEPKSPIKRQPAKTVETGKPNANAATKPSTAKN
jgi:hypothetical protein